jgi:phage repressor protein C with HTH and peptisase S24 domain
MNPISSRIQDRMRTLNLKQVDIYHRLGVSRGAASAWVNGTNAPSGENLERLARALDCTPRWLMFGGDEVEEKIGLGLDSSALGESSNHDFVDIPVYNAELSAGNGTDAGECEIIDYYPINKRLLEEKHLTSSEVAIVKVRGESMMETLWNNDLILVQTSIEKPVSNTVFAFAFDNELRVKRFTKKMDGMWRIISDNEDKGLYPDEFLSPFNIDSINFIGRVIKVIDRDL